MKTIPLYGAIYDAIFYGVLYFNKERYKAYAETQYGGNEALFQYYDKMSKKIPMLPEELYPFFYWDTTRPSYLTNFLFYTTERVGEDFDDLMDKINKTDIKTELIQHFFKDNDGTFINCDTPSWELIEAVLNLRKESSLTKQLINFIYNYDSIMRKLQETLHSIYKEMYLFHMSLADEYDRMNRDFSQERTMNQMRDYFGLRQGEDISGQILAISLLNTYLITLMMLKEDENQYVFFLGPFAETAILVLGCCQPLEAEKVLDVLAHPVRRDILTLLKDKPYTATQLSELLFTARQSVNRHITVLLNAMVIKFAKRNGSEVYYTLNGEFFKAAKKAVNQYFDAFEV